MPWSITPRQASLDLAKRLKLLNSGAAPMAVELIEKVKDMGIFSAKGMACRIHLGSGSPIRFSGLKKSEASAFPYRITMSDSWIFMKGRKMCPRGSRGRSS